MLTGGKSYTLLENLGWEYEKFLEIVLREIEMTPVTLGSFLLETMLPLGEMWCQKYDKCIWEL